jgi:hypothetical protein
MHYSKMRKTPEKVLRFFSTAQMRNGVELAGSISG